MAAAKKATGLQADIFWEAVAFPFRNLLSLTQIALIPWLITEGLYWALLKLIPRLAWPLFSEPLANRRTSGEVDPFELIPDLINAPISIIYYAFFAMLAVAIHRLIILGERPGWVIYRFGRNELAYAGAFIAVSALIWLPILFARQLATYFGVFYTMWFAIGYSVYMIVCTVLVIKLLLIYPHAAVTGRLSFAEAWTAMKGYLGDTISTLVICWILAVCVGLPIIFLTIWLHVDFVEQGHWTMTLFDVGWTILNIVIFSMAVALVSFFYRDIMASRGESITPKD